MAGGLDIFKVRVRILTLLVPVLMLLPGAMGPVSSDDGTDGPVPDLIPPVPLLENGPHTVFVDEGSVDMTSGYNVQVDIHYPGYEGIRGRLDRDQLAPFPVIIFSPGAGAPASNYESYLNMWASWGFVVAGVSWEYEYNRDEDVAYRDHGKVLTLLDEMDDDWRSPFYNVPDISTCGAVGHSRGGRAAFMSSSAEARILAVSAWMPTLDNASEVRGSASKILFGGTDDEIAPPDTWQDPLYNSTEEPIVYLVLQGGDHSTDADVHPTITLDFFKFHLKGDSSVETDVYGAGIRGRAESGEFRLRIKQDGGKYDSAPPPPDDPGEGDDEGTTGFPGGVLIVILLLIAVVVILIRFPKYRQSLVRRVRRKDPDEHS